jgi:signal transduction histidine kinase
MTPPGAGDWHSVRGRFFRRVSALLLALLFFASCGCVALFMVLNRMMGPPGAESHPARWLALPIVLIGVILLGMTLAIRALRRAAIPLAEMMEATGRVAEGDYSVRVAIHGPREARALGRAFNSMVERLQNHEQQRRSLLADVTHELRTPLTVIQGHLEGMLDGIYPRDDAHLRPVLEETQQISHLIDDLRTLALAESGALKLEKEPADLVALIHETADSFQAQATQSGVKLLVDASPDLPLVELDAIRLRQVIANLIANALRYTQTGGQVRVRVHAASTASAKGSIELSVSDNGAGIPEQDLPYIFDRFYKSRDSGGMGLGLAIARNLVLAHGGTIQAESQVGQGTTIRFTLPFELAHA